MSTACRFATHLRSRGEHQVLSAARVPGPDPPPLARRARIRPGPGRSVVRPTSARAESTLPHGLPRAVLRTHLRSRGEHRLWIGSMQLFCDPPPLARRARKRLRHDRGLLRPTSARAESTAAAVRSPRSRTTHLRSRGEHPTMEESDPRRTDPPPLARRARRRTLPLRARLRPTSARAESTPVGTRGRRLRPTHLRSRGEHIFGSAFRATSSDPPPLARRAPQTCRSEACKYRPTSARAESTITRGPDMTNRTTHLRSRGEHSRAPLPDPHSTDPPPLARRAHFLTWDSRRALPFLGCIS